MTAIDDLMTFFETQARLGRACGVSRQAANLWVMAGRIPEDRLPMIEEYTNGRWTADELRKAFGYSP